MFWKWIYLILRDERGEGEPGDAGAGGQGEPPIGQGEPPVGDEGLGGEGGQGGTPPPVTPAFGDFGDTPKTLEEATAILQKVYGKFSEINPQVDGYKTKLTATERNLATTRQLLEQTGIKITQDEYGRPQLQVVNKPERKVKFTDEHKGLFEEKVLNAIRFLVQDELDNGLESYTKTNTEHQQRQVLWNRVYDQSTKLMFSHFPQLNPKLDENGKPTNAVFNEAFYNKVAERAESEGYKGNPRGELLAALEIAQKMGITTQMIAGAKKAGFEEGKAGKKILGPVGQGGAVGKPKGSKLSKEEYLKLSPEDKTKYDKEQLGIS